MIKTVLKCLREKLFRLLKDGNASYLFIAMATWRVWRTNVFTNPKRVLGRRNNYYFFNNNIYMCAVCKCAKKKRMEINISPLTVAGGKFFWDWFIAWEIKVDRKWRENCFSEFSIKSALNICWPKYLPKYNFNCVNLHH